MREILFRGKRVDNGEWAEGFYGQPQGEGSSYADIYPWEMPKFSTSIELVRRVVDVDTVGQYIGLTDKNGKKIFEGDIIRGTIVSQWSKREIVCEVVYERDSFISKENNGNFHKLMFAKNIEVIGNIHNNPELLEGKHNENNT